MIFTPLQQNDIFDEKPREKIDFHRLIDEGSYHFKVIKAADQISKNSGNKMIALTLLLTIPDGTKHMVFDYLLEKYPKKIKSFCDSVGISEKYSTGKLYPEDCLQKEGFVEIKIGKAEEKENGEFYPEKNEVKYYKNKFSNSKKEKQAVNELMDDQITF